MSPEDLPRHLDSHPIRLALGARRGVPIVTPIGTSVQGLSALHVASPLYHLSASRF
jgi:hypothetical protein